MGKPHDADACFCGDDEHSTPDTYVPCPCPCDECNERRNRIRRFMDMEGLMKRLLGANIQPETVADMVWCIQENVIEERIKKTVRLEVRRILKGVKLQSEVWGSSLDFD